MSQWSEYFNKHMQLPNIITESALVYESSVLASSTENVFIEDSEITKAWDSNCPREAIVINEEKYFYMRDLCDGQDGYSLSLYQKVKAPEDAPGETTVLFVARMDSFLWVGKFNGQHRTEVIPYVESIASYIFMYFIKREE
ncbi:hypothetical protein NEDG_00840 [Nematocida displodere]|uniref:Profilin n=1 Tax=Nematocida displodere TaxID=1805483 RepID=A0A177ECP6_9MICR|nr:hypothetical protein NEDG_00840 [Nematocida displodere]